MAEQLLRWLNHELQLSTHVINIEIDFANGYLLGELLYRLNQQHNLADFVRNSSADAKVINFCLLEPTLCRLNVKFDANVAAGIMNKKKDVAANLLYQIKMAAARVSRAPGISTRLMERTGIIPLHNRPEKLAKSTYDMNMSRIFKQTIRRRVRSIKSLQQEEDQIEEDKKNQRANLARLAEQKEYLEATIAERRHRAFLHNSYIQQAIGEMDKASWKMALQKKNAREQRQDAFFRQLTNKRQEEEALRRKVCCDLNEFDTIGELRTVMSGCNISPRKSKGFGLRSLTTALNTAFEKEKHLTPNFAMNEREVQPNPSETAIAADVIKHQRQQREKRRKDLALRRQRFLQECALSQNRLQTTREASLSKQLVLQPTNSEKSQNSEINCILAYTDVAIENRLVRNREYVKQQELDLLATIDRDACYYRSIIHQFEDDIEMQIVQRSDVQASINAASRFASEQISSLIVDDLIKFVLFIAKKREETLHLRDSDMFLTLETWDEYKFQFANGLSFEDLIPWFAVEAFGEDTSLDSHELDEYLSRFQPLPTILEQIPLSSTRNEDTLFPGATEIIEDHFVLGEEVKALRWISRLSPVSAADIIQEKCTFDGSSAELSLGDPVRPAIKPRQELRILVFGPPCSGKATLAKLLCESHNLVVISVHEFIFDAIQSSSELGDQINGFLINGKELPPELYSRVVIEAIKKNDMQDHVRYDKAGWVMHDLPATLQHDQYLDQCLTGDMDVAAPESPYQFMSAIALGRPRPPLSSAFFHGKSGIDLALHIEVPTNAVLDRCLGRVEDCATGDKYHLVFDPPPDKSTARHCLRHVNPSTYSSELLSLHCWAKDEFQHDHKAWYRKFDTLRELSCAEMSMAEMHEAIARIVDQVLRDRQRKAEVKQQKQEADEQALMLSEEERQKRFNVFETEIYETNATVTKIEASLAEAELAKVKKEEIMELRKKLDEARRQFDATIGAARCWVNGEKVCNFVTKSKLPGGLSLASAQVLSAIWNNMEMEYVSTVKASFSMLRKQRHRVTDRMQQIICKFCEFVRRPDKKQLIVNEFQSSFNEVIDEMRFEEFTKVELHARTDIFQDNLVTLVEAKVKENNEELDSMIDDKWVEDMCQQVAVIYQMALQAERDRFQVSVHVLLDGHYVASSNRSQLKSIVELWQSYRSRLESPCTVYRNSVDDLLIKNASPPVAADKTSSKGKAKASAPAVVPSTNVTATIVNAPADSLTMTELLAEYTHVLKLCSSWMEAIAPIANAATSQDVESEAADQQINGDFCMANLLNGLKYECKAMERRVQFLRESSEKACNEITKSMKSIESTLRDVLEKRKDQEEIAIAAVIEYVRAAIEREVALPLYIDISPEVVKRFPVTSELPEDTMVRIDGNKRLLPLPIPIPPPCVEVSHDLLLNPRQRDSLESALIAQTYNDSGLLPYVVVVEIIAALPSRLNALPNAWRWCPPHVIAEIVAQFIVNQSEFVDVKALIDAMSSRDDLLRQFLPFEPQQDLQMHEEKEQNLLLQQETPTNDSDASLLQDQI
ncbi:putative adenylate kinase/UMP-CMP kinase, calponin domain, CH domain superfamily [Plasmopara halstedii]